MKVFRFYIDRYGLTQSKYDIEMYFEHHLKQLEKEDFVKFYDCRIINKEKDLGCVIEVRYRVIDQDDLVMDKEIFKENARLLEELELLKSDMKKKLDKADNVIAFTTNHATKRVLKAHDQLAVVGILLGFSVVINVILLFASIGQ
jgi:hypothetical protein